MVRARFVLPVALAAGVALGAGCSDDTKDPAALPSAKPTVTASPTPTAFTTPTCPTVDQVRTAVSEQNGVWQAGSVLEPKSIRCAGQFLTAVVTVQVDDGTGKLVPQGYQVLLRQSASGLTWLENGSGPICTTDPRSTTGNTYVPLPHGKTLGCQPF